MKIRSVALSLFTALSLLAATIASAQTYGPGGQSQIAMPAIPATPLAGSTTFSAACSTPLTPLSCPAGSFVVFDLSSGGDEWSFQINTPNGITIAPETSNDDVNFFASSVSIPGTTPLQTTSTVTTSGKFSGLGAASHYVALVATVAPTSAITIYPYLSAHNTGVSLHASTSLYVQPVPSASAFNIHSVDPTPTPAPSSGLPVNVLSGTFNGVYSSPSPTLTPGVPWPFQLTQNGALIVSGSFTANTNASYAFNTGAGQTGLTGSGFGALGYYSPTTPTLTSAGPAALSLDSSANLNFHCQIGCPTPIPWSTASPEPVFVTNQSSGGGGTSTVTFPFGPTPGPTGTGNNFLGIGGVYASPNPSPSPGQFVPISFDSQGNLRVSGTFTATANAQLALPFTGATAQPSPQPTALVGSESDCLYESTPPTLTATNNVDPCLVDVNGNHLVKNVLQGTGGATYQATQIDTSTASANITTNTTTLLVAGVTGQNIFVSYAGWEATGTNTSTKVIIEDGTGTLCGTNTGLPFTPFALNSATATGGWTVFYGGAYGQSTSTTYGTSPAPQTLAIPAGYSLCGVTTVGSPVAGQFFLLTAQH